MNEITHPNQQPPRNLAARITSSLKILSASRPRFMIQRILEEEVEDLLGRVKSQRRAEDGGSGYRNGHGPERRLSTSVGTITVRRPRVRATQERFVSRVLPLFQRRTAGSRRHASQALPPRAGAWRLRTGASRPSRRRSSALGFFDSQDATPFGRRNTLVAAAAAGPAAGCLPLGRRHLRQGGLEKDKAVLLVVIAGLPMGPRW